MNGSETGDMQFFENVEIKLYAPELPRKHDNENGSRDSNSDGRLGHQSGIYPFFVARFTGLCIAEPASLSQSGGFFLSLKSKQTRCARRSGQRGFSAQAAAI